MRRTLILLALMLCALPVEAQQRGRFSWQYDTALDAFCAAGENSCIAGFQLFYLSSAGAEVAAGNLVAPSACTGTGIVSCTVDAPQPVGFGKFDKVKWYVRVMARDSSGALVPSPESNIVEVRRDPFPAINFRAI